MQTRLGKNHLSIGLVTTPDEMVIGMPAAAARLARAASRADVFALPLEADP